MRRRNQYAPHILATVESECRPEYTYKPCPLNPLRVLVLNVEGEVISAVYLVRGSRESLLRQLRAKTPHVYPSKYRHSAGLEWGTRA